MLNDFNWDEAKVYGRQAVWRELKKGLKMHFLCFQPFLGLVS